MPRKGVLIGYDHRFASDHIAAAVADTISATGTPVWVTDKPCPTPAISLLVRQRKAAGGLVITASHNPYRWNGIKYKASYGSSALPSIVAQIETELAAVQRDGVPPLPPRKDLIQPLEPRAPYLDTIEKLVDWDRLRAAKFRFVSDPMHGSAAGLLPDLFKRNGIACDEIRGTRDPRFGGVHPEPIEPHIAPLRQAVLAGKYDAGFCADGDGDRIGAIDRDGSFVNPHQIFALARLAPRRNAQSPGRHRQNFFRHQADRQARREIQPQAPRSTRRLQIHLRADARAKYPHRWRRKRRYRHQSVPPRARRHGLAPCCWRN